MSKAEGFNANQPDDEEDSYYFPEVIPSPEEELSFTEKLRKILGFESDDEDDEEESDGTKKKSIFKKLFSKIPGVVDVDTAEEAPAATERSFSLSFLGAPEVDESIVQPHEAEEATVVEPEAQAFDSEIVPPAEEIEHVPEPVEPYQPPINPELPEPIETASPIEAEPEVPDPPVVTPIPSPVAQPIFAGGGGPAPVTQEHRVTDPSPIPETEDFITRREAKHRDKKVEKAANVREHKITKKTEERDEALKERIKDTVAQFETEKARLRRQIEEQHAAAEFTPVPRSVLEQPPRPQIVTKEAPRPVVETAQPQQRPLQRETYSPDVHDHMPPKEAFEKLTGIEPQRRRSLEEERRFEVKDEPSKVPVRYTQIDEASASQRVPQAAAQTQRSKLISLGAAPAVESVPQQAPATQDTVYKKAVISGAVTAVVVLGAILAFALLR